MSEPIGTDAKLDEIDRLRARVAELEQTVDGIWRYAVDTTVSDHHFRGWAEVEARAALQQPTEPHTARHSAKSDTR